MVKKICAWCKKDLGSLSAFDVPEDTPITHGMCSDCARKTMSFRAKHLRVFLDQFSKPVFLVNAEGIIVTGNGAGLSLLKKKPEEVDGELAGDAFDCKYADLDGGCGNTVHCKTCTIRNSIMSTLQTGQSNIRIPAYPDLHYMTGENKVRYLITTERIGEAVLLRIDEVALEKPSPKNAPADKDIM